MLIGAPNVRSLSALKATPNCTIGVTSPGSSLYGYASYYNQTLGLHCQLVQFENQSLMVSAVLSGRTSAAGGTYDLFSKAIPQGAHILIDTRLMKVRQRYLGPAFTEVGYFGMTPVLRAKRAAVTRFLHVLGEVNQAIATLSPQALAGIVHESSAFSAVPTSQLAAEYSNDKAYLDPDTGFITKKNWNLGLSSERYWGVTGFSPTAKVYSYNRVDMSYYTAGIGSSAGQ